MNDKFKELKAEHASQISYANVNALISSTKEATIFTIGLFLSSSWNWFLWIALMVLLFSFWLTFYFFSEKVEKVKEAKKEAVRRLDEEDSGLKA